MLEYDTTTVPVTRPLTPAEIDRMEARGWRCTDVRDLWSAEHGWHRTYGWVRRAPDPGPPEEAA